MRKIKLLFFFSFFIFSQVLLASTEKVDYRKEFEKVLLEIQANSIRNGDTPPIDWNDYKASLKTQPMQSEADFFKALKIALKNLNDSHSFIVPPYAIKKIAQTPTLVNKIEPSVEVKNGIGIVKIPGYYQIDPNDYFSPQWVEKFHQKLNAQIKAVTKGWIIDLTENDRGSIYPMLGACSLFFQNKHLGGYFLIEENAKPLIQKITFENGKLEIDIEGYQYPQMKLSKLPAMVLIGPNTASSGELLALALKRQPQVKLIGQPTYGIATVNMQMKLPDVIGGFYMLTVGYYLDENDQPLKSATIVPHITFNGSHEALMAEASRYILEPV